MKLKNLSRSRLVWIGVGLVCAAVAWWQVLAVNRGLVVRDFVQDGVPIRYLVRDDVADVPGVVVAHGFSGSRQLMLAYGFTLAKAGYGVALLDFAGHAANANPFPTDGGDQLQADLDAALATLTAQPEVDGSRVALLGHSMGSGAVMRAGVRLGDAITATIAVSPTSAEVSSALPRNFFLMAGQFEQRFVDNALGLLTDAGGANDDFGNGRARTFQEIPSVEHITILFSPISLEAARTWLDNSFGTATNGDYRDGRMVWYGLHLLGWLLIGVGLSPLLPSAAKPPASARRQPWFWLALVLAALVTGGLLAAVNQLIELGGLGGILIGGVMGLWFLLVGLAWLLLGFPLSEGWLWVNGRVLLYALITFALMWVAFGAMAQVTWLPWLLIPARLLRWPLLTAAFLPYFLAAGRGHQGETAVRRTFWWLGESLILAIGLMALAFMVPALIFLTLIVPVLPLVLGVLAIVNTVIDEPLAYGLGAAGFFAWLILALFPYVG